MCIKEHHFEICMHHSSGTAKAIHGHNQTFARLETSTNN